MRAFCSGPHRPEFIQVPTLAQSVSVYTLTHCRAGWIVALAGEGGRAMEFCMGTPAAAALIYLASDWKIERIPDFYTTNKMALADMKRLAEQETSESTHV